MNQPIENIPTEQPRSEQPIENTPPEQPEVAQPIESNETSQPESEAAVFPGVEKTQPSRFGQFIRKALLWLLIIAIGFLSGFLVDYFLRYRPLADVLAQSRATLDQTSQELDDIKAENESLKREIKAANDDISTLEEELDAATANIRYFQILVDVNNARINLFLEDFEGAQAALVDTKGRLEDLLPFIEDIDPELAVSLPRRLDLIISGLVRDPEAGRIDLELFTKDLLELEPLLIDN